MELFPDGAFVRLESRGKRGKYVHADGDWFGVSLRPLGSSSVASQLESVWRVEHWNVFQEEEEEGAPAVFLHLQNAAYGRYLCISPLHAPSGHRGRRAVQGDLNEPPDEPTHAYVWRGRAERVDPDHGDHVRLRHNTGHDLRANGRHRSWNTGVTLQINRRRVLTTMMQWTVHAVAASHVPIPLPDPVVGAPPPPHQPQAQGRLRRLMFWRRRDGNHGLGVYQHPERTIRHVRADDDGVFVFDHLQNWPAFTSYDHSVFNLRTQLSQLQTGWNGDMLAFTLCIVPGSHGRIMPLVTDLPRSLEPVNIVVHRTGSPAAAELVYPQIDAPAQ